jgi:dihydroorotate dehydrogenase electron transfer subunit
MNKKVSEFIVIENIRLNYNNFLIELQSSIVIEDIQPGQFVNILIQNSPSTFLRRPFSIFNVNYERNTIFVLVKIAGIGTQNLVNIKKGDTLNLIFPLGKGFSIPKANEKVLLVGGGVGVAPLMFLAKEAVKMGADVNVLLGARSINDHILIEEFKKYGRVSITTDDGSLGTKGFVVSHDVFESDFKFDRIYSCGPDAMMHAVAQKASFAGIDCEVSLENMMACGFGVCLCCVTKTTEGNKCVCTEGPVFNIRDLQW